MRYPEAKVNYEQDFDFWINCSPQAVMRKADYNQDFKNKMTERQWKNLCNKVYEKEYGTKNRFS